MVLDIRHLRYGDLGKLAPTLSQSDLATLATSYEEPDAALVAPEPESEPEPGIEQLLEEAASSDLAARARAVEQLRLLVPSASGMDLLWQIAADPQDRRRLEALQVLGFHRSWISSRTRLRRAVELLEEETDADVATTLAWCLRQRPEVGRFLNHRHAATAVEAAIGLSLNAATIDRCLGVILGSANPDVVRVLRDKCRQLHPSLVLKVVERLVAEEVPERPRAELLSRLPQVALFEALFLEPGHAAWDPGQGLKSAESARRWNQLSQQALDIMRQGPSVDLVRLVLARSGEDEEFARRHGGFLKEIMRRVHCRDGGTLVKHFERLTSGASEEKVARLAQLLVDLSTRLDGGPGQQAAMLLEEWKERSAVLRLKIYHMQQGLG